MSNWGFVDALTTILSLRGREAVQPLSDEAIYCAELLMVYDREYCVYIMTNWKHTVLYTGVTNDLARRVNEHRSGSGSAFARRYNLNKLVFVEITDQIQEAIAREKQIKAGSRQKKIDLITDQNPDWKDLYEEFFGN